MSNRGSILRSEASDQPAPTTEGIQALKRRRLRLRTKATLTLVPTFLALGLGLHWTISRILLNAFGSTEANQVREELAGGLSDAAARRLHSLKGNAGSLGALTIMDLAGQLEEAIDGGDRDIDQALAELDRQLQNLRLASAPWL